MRSSTNQKVQIRLTLSGEKKRIPGLRSAYGSQCRQKVKILDMEQYKPLTDAYFCPSKIYSVNDWIKQLANQDYVDDEQ